MKKRIVVKASKQSVEGATHISCYDDTNTVIQKACEELDMTEPEFIDTVLEYAAEVWEEFKDIYNDWYYSGR